MPGKWKRPEAINPKCDFKDIRSQAQKLYLQKERELRVAGTPINGEVRSTLRTACYAEARAQCKPVDMAVTEDMMENIVKVCPPCAAKYSLKGQAKLPIEGQPAAEPAAEPEADIHVTAKRVTEITEVEEES